MINIRNPREYCENFLYIQDKRNKLRRLEFKPAQVLLYEKIKAAHEKGPVRMVVLKGRQMGCSTMIEGIFFADTATTSNASELIMAHDDTATRHLFDMNKMFLDKLPGPLRPMQCASNARELVFDNPSKDKRERERNPGLNSRIICMTAGSPGGARSFTFRNVHGSEVAFWPNFLNMNTAIMQAVPMEADTCVIYETTANGINDFKKFWDDAVSGENGFEAVFLPWYLDPDYVREVEPGTEWTDYEKEMMERLGLSPEQMSWRRWCIKTNCSNREDLFRQEYPSTPEEAFLTTGRPFFNNERINLLLASTVEPEMQGFFEFDLTPEGKPENIRWTEDRKNPLLKIWKKPQRGRPYVIGADGAGDGTDSFTMFCIDNMTGRQTAEYQWQQSEILFTRQLWCLGEFFNWALIALEVNYGSYASLMLEQWEYPNLYQRQRYDTIKKDYEKAYGWRTDSNTRPLMLGNLRTVMDETPETVRSAETLRQMLVFQYDEHGKPQAISGEHDDLVMAAAICLQARGQQKFTETEEQEPKKEKLVDQLMRKNARVIR